MTRMSDPRCARPRSGQTARRVTPVARALHGLPAIVLAGCVLPPSLSVDKQDAGMDSPPAIVSVRSDTQELDEPGPVEFDVAPTAQDQSIDLTLVDSDIADNLYVRVFVNYTDAQPTPPRATCTAASTGTPTRTTNCNLQALCLKSDVGNTDLMEVVVFDRAPLDSGTPAFKATNGGMSTDRTYPLLCEQASP
jgi:hypothetical protein